MDCSPRCSSVHGILQARILEWIAFPFSRDLPNPGIEPGSLALQADSLPFRLQNRLQVTVKTSRTFTKTRIKDFVPYDPAIPLLGIHTKETRIERDMCTPMFITALFIIARTWKQPRCPSADEWIRKLWYIIFRFLYLFGCTRS